MSYRRALTALTLALPFLSTAAFAQAYDLAVASPPAPNPWQLDLVSTQGEFGSRIYSYQVINTETGAPPRNLTIGEHASLQINRRGEVLYVSKLAPWQDNGIGTGSLFLDGQQQTSLDGVLSASLRDDGTVIATQYAGNGHTTTAMFTNGKWYGSPGGTASVIASLGGVNSQGDLAVSLFSRLSSSTFRAQAVIDDVTIDLPCVPGSVFGCGNTAGDINDALVVVGSQSDHTDAGTFNPSTGSSVRTLAPSFATIWDADQGSRNLNALIDPGSILYGKAMLQGATAIDNMGNILAWGHLLTAPETRLEFTLTAVPEPQTWALLAWGAVAVGAMARRHRSKGLPAV